jgi:hypothetical protein
VTNLLPLTERIAVLEERIDMLGDAVKALSEVVRALSSFARYHIHPGHSQTLPVPASNFRDISDTSLP